MDSTIKTHTLNGVLSSKTIIFTLCCGSTNIKRLNIRWLSGVLYRYTTKLTKGNRTNTSELLALKALTDKYHTTPSFNLVEDMYN